MNHGISWEPPMNHGRLPWFMGGSHDSWEAPVIHGSCEFKGVLPLIHGTLPSIVWHLPWINEMHPLSDNLILPMDFMRKKVSHVIRKWSVEKHTNLNLDSWNTANLFSAMHRPAMLLYKPWREENFRPWKIFSNPLPHSTNFYLFKLW